mmetsp:Transcript_54985/g.159668  ORF Transcript_54985/g.159668 Transcript_54985/m.159668 type:complete len:1155 (-) Transcript_54985:465-3929(-)
MAPPHSSLCGISSIGGAPIEERINDGASINAASVVFAMGNNSDGQLGVGVSGEDEDKIFEPRSVAALEGHSVVSAAASLKHSAWLTKDGIVYTAGDNDASQLGRTGRRTRPLAVEAVQHLPIEDVAVGGAFTVMVARLDGRLLGVGQGDRGQLGMGGADRDHKEKVKFSAALGDEQLLALAAGDAHCAALCRSGRVLTFGENKHGQLGVGDFVSSATPKPVAGLHSRPVVRICCGSAHTLARTATGCLWSWGCNDQGQLGLGDFRQRFRPEQVKALRVSRCIDVAAGSRHTLAISERGLVFAFGAGGSGQLGSGGISEAEPMPRVVESLREAGRCSIVACGHSHSLALIVDEDVQQECLYAWGLGSSGQLGLPLDSLPDKKIAPLPQRVHMCRAHKVVDIASGPLAHHTFLLLAPMPPADVGAKQPKSLMVPASRHFLRTAIDADSLLETLRQLSPGEGGCLRSEAKRPRASDDGGVRSDARSSLPLKAITKAVGAAFSSVSVLNASFRTSSGQLAVSEEQSGVDLLKVRRAYRTLIFEIESADLTATLGRATLSICDELAKHRVPTDDPESLCVFLVLFENPLLLAEHRTSLFPGFHRALQNLIAAVLSLPKDSQRLLFGWLKRLPSEYFGQVVDVIQQFISFVLTQPGQNKGDASAAVLMLRTLWSLNKDMGGILPEWCFHNVTISRSDDLQEHYRQWNPKHQTQVFSYCKFPFLLDAEAKRRLMSLDAKMRAEIAMQELIALVQRNELEAEIGDGFEHLLKIRVRRDHLLSDFSGQIWWRIRHQPQCLQLPLSVEFIDELGVDAGGLRKECLQLVLRHLYHRTRLFVELDDLPGLVWFRPTSIYLDASWRTSDFAAPPWLRFYSPDWPQHLPEVAGAIVGLAVANGLHLDLRLHPLVYRFLAKQQAQVDFDDLQGMYPTLHRSLVALRRGHGGFDVQSLCLSWLIRLPGADDADPPYDLREGCVAAKTTAADVDDSHDVVSGDDMHDFTERYAEAVLVGAKRRQLESFVQAAMDGIAKGHAFSLCSAHDLELLVCGSPDVGYFHELEATCKYANGYDASSPTVRFFWEVVHSMCCLDKRNLLLFCTGCDRVPILGLQALDFVVARSTAPLDHLPTANICANQLNLPAYDNLETTRVRLLAALEHNVGFGFA